MGTISHVSPKTIPCCMSFWYQSLGFGLVLADLGIASVDFGIVFHILVFQSCKSKSIDKWCGAGLSSPTILEFMQCFHRISEHIKIGKPKYEKIGKTKASITQWRNMTRFDTIKF